MFLEKEIILKMRFFFLVSFLFIANVLFAQTQDKEDLAFQVQQLFQMIRKESPELYQQMQKQPRQEVLQRVLSALHSGVTAAGVPGKTPGSTATVFPGKLLEKKRILYQRFAVIDADSVKQFTGFFTKEHAGRKGLILDLRGASGGTSQDVLKLVAFLKQTTINIAVITDEQTSGAPELLAGSLAVFSRVITLGEPGAGHPYPYLLGEAADMVWRIPQLPVTGAAMLPESLIPQILVKGKQLPYESLADADSLNRDAALRKALDLLLARSALEQ